MTNNDTASWNPEERPWRVVRYMSSGPHGWSTKVSTFATEVAARADFDEDLGHGVTTADLDFAENAATWLENGRWRCVDQRRATDAVICPICQSRITLTSAGRLRVHRKRGQTDRCDGSERKARLANEPGQHATPPRRR